MTTQYHVYNNGDCEASLWTFDIWTGSAWECPALQSDDCAWYESKEDAEDAAKAYIASI